MDVFQLYAFWLTLACVMFFWGWHRYMRRPLR